MGVVMHAAFSVRIAICSTEFCPSSEFCEQKTQNSPTPSNLKNRGRNLKYRGRLQIAHSLFSEMSSFCRLPPVCRLPFHDTRKSRILTSAILKSQSEAILQLTPPHQKSEVFEGCILVEVCNLLALQSEPQSHRILPVPRTAICNLLAQQNSVLFFLQTRCRSFSHSLQKLPQDCHPPRTPLRSSNLQSAIGNLKSAICNLQSAI